MKVLIIGEVPPTISEIEKLKRLYPNMKIIKINESESESAIEKLKSLYPNGEIIETIGSNEYVDELTNSHAKIPIIPACEIIGNDFKKKKKDWEVKIPHSNKRNNKKKR